MTRLAACLTGIVTLVLAANALACGESLFRVGKGVMFRQYTAPLPGNIIAVANTEAELMMVERLIAAGHDVHVVGEPADMHEALSEHDFDIVLAYFSQRSVVDVEAASAGLNYIPVARSGTDEETLAADLYAESLSSDDSVKRFLKAIHRTLKARG